MPSTRRYDFLLVLTVLIWGLNFIVTKAVLAVVPPLTFNALRLSFSLLVIGLYFLYVNRGKLAEVLRGMRQRWGILTVEALLVSGVYQTLFIFGLNYTTAGNSALIIASAPLWTAVIGQLFGLERLPGSAWGGLLLSFSGTVAVVLGGANALNLSEDTFLGNLLILGSALAWAIFTVTSRPLMKHVQPTDLTFVTLITGPLLFWPLAAPELDAVPWASLSTGVWAGILFSGALSTGAAYIFYNVAVKHLGASQTAAWSNVVPFVALLSGLIFLSEPITPLQIGGGALLITGLYLMRRARRLTLPPSP